MEIDYELCLWQIYRNRRRHFQVKFCTTATRFNKYYTDNFYKGHRILNEDVTAVYRHKATCILDRLYAIGFTILEVSKEHMFSSYYDFFQPALGGYERVELVLTDTDSLLLHVKAMSRKEMFLRLKPILDFSNYPMDHPRFNERVKAIPGFFKDESCGHIMTEVVGLRAKCYICQIRHSSLVSSTSIVCKGVGKQARQNLTLAAYRSCIIHFNLVKAIMYCIRSKKHDLYTQRIKKVALSSSDDKRYILECGRHTRPYGFTNQHFPCTICGELSSDSE